MECENMNKNIIILIGLILILAGASLSTWERVEQQKGSQLIQKQQEQFQIGLQKLDQIVTDQSDIKSTEVMAQFSEQVKLPHGILLVTGPTGSGKSTTLYSA
ncbi:unnamed protein product, partial [marine sediment metagenome]